MTRLKVILFILLLSSTRKSHTLLSNLVFEKYSSKIFGSNGSPCFQVGLFSLTISTNFCASAVFICVNVHIADARSSTGKVFAYFFMSSLNDSLFSRSVDRRVGKECSV